MWVSLSRSRHNRHNRHKPSQITAGENMELLSTVGIGALALLLAARIISSAMLRIVEATRAR